MTKRKQERRQTAKVNSNLQNVLSETAYNPTSGAPVTWSWAYNYDSLNRLINSKSAGNMTWGCSETYDGWGNRTAQAAYGGGGYTCTSSSNPVTAGTNRSSVYPSDSSGNITSVGSAAMTYDAEGRQSTYTASGTTTSYVYGADGQRVGKITGGVETNYLRDVDGSLLATYLNASYANVPEEMWISGRHFGTATATKIGGVTSQTQNFSLTNWLGSEAVRTDPATGIPQSAFVSQPFGDYQTTLFSTIPDDDTHFTGKERDAESGNDYFGARYYASSMGRFMSPDPYSAIRIKQGMEAGGLPAEAAESFFNGFLEYPQKWNQYTYALNNPLRFVDPTGAAPAEGHHLIPERANLGDLGREFANKIKTGPLSGNGYPNQPGFNTAHREYNDAVRELLNDAENGPDGPSSNWSIDQWKAFANRILNSEEPAIKNFLDELEENNPGAKAALASSIAAYRASAGLIARTVAALVAARTRAFFGEIIICFTCEIQRKTEEVTHRIIYPGPA